MKTKKVEGIIIDFAEEDTRVTCVLKDASGKTYRLGIKKDHGLIQVAMLLISRMTEKTICVEFIDLPLMELTVNAVYFAK